MTTFPITINAAQLYFHQFQLAGTTGSGDSDSAGSWTSGWFSTALEHTLQLAIGTYAIAVLRSEVSAVQFTVTASGGVAYGASLEGVLQGNGTAKLTVTGCAVAIDASGLTGADPSLPNQTGVLLGGAAVDVQSDWIVNRAVRLLPGTGYTVLQGPGQQANFTFAIRANGTVFYDSSFDAEQGGFLQGNGTASLLLGGYAWKFDASTVSSYLKVAPVFNFPASSDGMAETALLPGTNFVLQLAPGAASVLVFSIGTDAGISFDDSLGAYLSILNENGEATLQVTAPPPAPQLQASPVISAVIWMGYKPAVQFSRLHTFAKPEQPADPDLAQVRWTLYYNAIVAMFYGLQNDADSRDEVLSNLVSYLNENLNSLGWQSPFLSLLGDSLARHGFAAARTQAALALWQARVNEPFLSDMDLIPFYDFQSGKTSLLSASALPEVFSPQELLTLQSDASEFAAYVFSLSA